MYGSLKVQLHWLEWCLVSQKILPFPFLLLSTNVFLFASEDKNALQELIDCGRPWSNSGMLILYTFQVYVPYDSEEFQIKGFVYKIQVLFLDIAWLNTEKHPSTH